MSKKTFRLENGKEVTAGLNIFRAYQSKRNKERYLERKRNEFVVRSIDDEQAAYDLKSDVDVEEEIEKNLRLEQLRNALHDLSKEEQQLIKEYFFENLSLRTISEKHGVSHTTVNTNINNILEKLKSYIINNEM